MNDCSRCQALLLEHLYGLLDGADNQPLLDHLAACPACRESLEQARRQQHLLAVAARQEFPAVRFEPPAEEAAPATLPLPAPRARRWARWAVAAALLLAVGGLAAPTAWYGRDYLQARAAVRAHDEDVARAAGAVHNVNEQLRQVPQERQLKLAEVVQEARARQLNVVVSGPQRVQVGAPNEYRIQTRNLDGKPVAARLDVRVVDQKGQAVLEEKNVKTRGEYQLTLQPNLPLRPDMALALEVNAHRDDDADANGSLREQLELAAPVYVTHLATDRPMYQPGDKVYFRSLTLERFSLKPSAEDFHLVYSITNGRGEKTDILQGAARLRTDKAELRGPDGQPLRGVGVGEYPIPEDAHGGEWTLTVREAYDRFPPQERKFLVNEYRPGPLNKELNFDRSSYGAGDTVIARCKVTRAGNGQPAADCKATPEIFIDDKAYGTDGQPGGKVEAFTANAAGYVDVVFKLPQTIARGQATLGVKFMDGQVPDGISRPIPVVVNKLDVHFYPEGGDLIGGADNRVYFEVRTPLDRPADLHGRIVDDRGDVVVPDVHTLTDAGQPGVNQGMGVFLLRPASARSYRLKIDSPAGMSDEPKLPESKMDGVALTVQDGVTGPNDPIRVKVCSPRADKSLLVGAYCRGRLLDHQMVTVKQGEWAEVALRPTAGAGGVYRVTAFEDLAPAADKRRQLKPLAERLVYREPAERLKLDVRPDQTDYTPGARVTLTVTAHDEHDRATGAVVLLRVVDQRTLKMADEKTARSMPTHFLLTTEVRKPEDLEHADFLLADQPKAHQALDLLLGTQGWRRFAEQNPAKFRNEHAADADRLLVTIGQSSTKVFDFAQREVDQVAQDFDGRAQELQREQGAAAAALVAVRDNPAAREASERLFLYEDWINRYGHYAAPVAGALLVVVLLGLLIVTLPRHLTRTAPFTVGAVLGALAVLVVSFLPLLERLDREKRASHEEFSFHFDGQVNAAPADAEAAVAHREIEQLRWEAVQAPPPAALPMPMAAAKPMAGGGMVPPRAFQFEDEAKGDKFDALKQLDAEGLAKGGDRNLGLNLARGDGKMKNAAADQKREKAGEARGGFGAGIAGLRDLREQAQRPAGAAGPAAGGRAFGGFRQIAPAPEPLFVREYAHAYKAPAPGAPRTDFAETLLWQPALIVPPEGRATVSFNLCDSVTTFEVAAAGHTLDGRLGTTSAAVESRLPFTLEPKVPIEVSSADRIDLPVNVSNNTGDRGAVRLAATVSNLELTRGQADDRLTVDARSAARHLYGFRPKVVEGEARVEFRGEMGPFTDSIARTFRIVPDGFPIVGSKSDLLEGSAVNDVVLPETWVKGTLKCRVQVYPSTLAALQQGLEGLLREPGGCFEQTSSSNYPNVLILDYLKESNQARPDVEGRARGLLERGYRQLTAFECPKTATHAKQGYEWFGAPDGAHEALTAYGLLEFRDMARVQAVDPAMLERTRQCLLAARDGKGGFTRNPQALDTFGRAPAEITNAYIVWALTEGGKDDDVTKELDALHARAKESKDPYFLSLVANGLLNRDRAQDGVALLRTVAALQKPDGHLDAERTSITGSGGRDLQIETTALAVLGWLKANRPGDFNVPVQNAVKWIGQQRGGYGGFGSTQSTILALKALIAHTRANKKTAEAGELTLLVGDVRVGRLEFLAGAQDVLTLDMPEAEKFLKAGKNTVRVRITGKNQFPYTLTWSYQTVTPVSAEGCAVRLTTKLDRAAANEGEAVHLSVTLENLKGQGQGMAVAVVGLPAGLSLPEDLKQLKEHARLRDGGTKAGLISAFETRSRELILYWRDLAPGQKIEVPVDLMCRVPGEYRGPASRAYLYYNADVKHWVEPLAVKIAAKE